MKALLDLFIIGPALGLAAGLLLSVLWGMIAAAAAIVSLGHPIREVRHDHHRS